MHDEHTHLYRDEHDRLRFQSDNNPELQPDEVYLSLGDPRACVALQKFASILQSSDGATAGELLRQIKGSTDVPRGERWYFDPATGTKKFKLSFTRDIDCVALAFYAVIADETAATNVFVQDVKTRLWEAMG